jgi:hypothetical protein
MIDGTKGSAMSVSTQDIQTQEISAGMPAALAALVQVLDEAGALSKPRYKSLIQGLWVNLPEDEASDKDAWMLRQLLDLLEQT